MKRFIVLVILSVVGVLSINTATSSAAVSCTAGHTYTWYAPPLAFQGQLTCSGVSEVQFAVNTASRKSGWKDNSNGLYYHDSSGYTTITFLANSSHNVSAAFNFTHASWCGGLVHSVYTGFWYRAKAFGGSYGSWYYRQSGNYNINC